MGFNPFIFPIQVANLAKKLQEKVVSEADPEQLDVLRKKQLARRQQPVRTLADAEPTGMERFRRQWRKTGYQLGSPQFDRWVITLQLDAEDPEYNNVLFDVQRKAQQRIRRREEEFSRQRRASLRTVEAEEPKEEPVLDETPAVKAEAKPPGRTVTILGPDGQPLPNRFVVRPDGSLVDMSSQLEMVIPSGLFDIPPEIQENLGEENAAALEGYAAEIEQGFAESGVMGEPRALMRGEYVWMGGTATQPAYMSAEDAIQLPYHWSADQVLYAQEALGMEPTGFADPGLINEWAKVVATAAGYTAAGRNVDPMTVLDWVHDAVMAQQGAGGGSGGGGGGRSLTRSETSSVLRQVMLDELGREPTTEEADAFHSEVGGIGLDSDVVQLAVEWIRNRLGGEAATFQVATDYYQAMLAVLGTKGEAAQPTEV